MNRTLVVLVVLGLAIAGLVYGLTEYRDNENQETTREWRQDFNEKFDDAMGRP